VLEGLTRFDNGHGAKQPQTIDFLIRDEGHIGYFLEILTLTG